MDSILTANQAESPGIWTRCRELQRYRGGSIVRKIFEGSESSVWLEGNKGCWDELTDKE